MKLTKVLLFLTAIGLVACGEKEPTTTTEPTTKIQVTAKDCQLKFGWESRKPYQFHENNKMHGIDVEIINQAAAQSGCQIKFVQDSWANLLALVEKGEIDVLAGATATDERKVYADFSTPYRAESFTLFILTSSDFSSDKLQEFLSRSNKVGIVNGYYYGDEIDNLIDHAQYANLFVGSNSTEKNFNRMQNRRIAGLLTDPIEGRYFIKRKGLSSKVRETAINLPSEQVSYMFSKKSKVEQLANIQANLSAMVEAKKIDQIIANYQ